MFAPLSSLRGFASRVPRSRFEVLCRAFFAQFFSSETVTSDEQMQRAMVGVLAFLITPALLSPIQMASSFEVAAIRFPAMLEPMTRQMATVYITYSMVGVGVIAAVMWDALSFDRRDAMVLGPLPLRVSTVIAAKITALALFLLIVAFAVNVITAVPFSMVAGNHKAVSGVLRHFVAHMVATMAASVFVFCLLVTLRAIVGGLSGRRVALASILRFLLFSALLCFIIFLPMALQVEPGGRRRQASVQMMTIPAWSPTHWFLGLHEWIRGSPGAEWDAGARRAIVFTVALTASAVITTIAGYRRQLQIALTPSATDAVRSAARLPRLIARLATGRSRLARAVSDFILATVARSSTQQATIAVNAAIGLTLVVASLLRTRGDLAQLMRPRTAVLGIPLVLTYWIAIGLRAAFFVPSELPASWTFRCNAPLQTTEYWSATRAAAIGFLLPLALVADALIAPLIGAGAAAWHALIVIPVVLLLAETIALTVTFVPFTRPYEPGHARVKTRWPLYLLGLFAFAIWPARAAMFAAGRPADIAEIAAWLSACAVVLEIAGRFRARTWTIDPAEEFQDESTITVLDIGIVLRHEVST
jgi:ABC-type transport system involved in multi-copper enzyme maturation permease subunit